MVNVNTSGRRRLHLGSVKPQHAFKPLSPQFPGNMYVSSSLFSNSVAVVHVTPLIIWCTPRERPRHKLAPLVYLALDFVPLYVPDSISAPHLFPLGGRGAPSTQARTTPLHNQSLKAEDYAA